jgi:hypothetical protein
MPSSNNVETMFVQHMYPNTKTASEEMAPSLTSIHPPVPA